MVKVRTRKEQKEQKNKVGRPNIPRDEKKDPNTGFTLAQKDWIEKEARGRGIDKTEIHREMAEMYITAVESQRGDSDTQKLFDVVEQLNNKTK